MTASAPPSRRAMLATALAIPALAGWSPARAAATASLGDDQSQAMSWLVRHHLLDDAASPVLGDSGANATIVEFFDYRCPYCKVMAPRVAEVIDADPKLRFVMKEYPILGPQSVVAAQVALVASRHGVYRAFHLGMFALSGPFERPQILAVARTAGLDPAQAAREMDDPEILSELRGNLAVASMLGIAGTPAFVVGGTVVPGAIPIAGLRKLAAAARAPG